MNTATQKVSGITNYHQTKIKKEKRNKTVFLRNKSLNAIKDSHHLFSGSYEEFKHFPEKGQINVWGAEEKVSSQLTQVQV